MVPAMPNEDFRVIALCLTLALGLMMGAIRQADWKHKALIRSLLGAAMLLFAVALGWLWIKDWVPRVGASMGELAAHPVTWFVTGMFCVAAIMFRTPKPTASAGPAASGPVYSWPNMDVAYEDTALRDRVAALAGKIADLETVAMARLDQKDALFNRHYTELRAGLDALRAVVGASSLPPRQVRFDPTTHDGMISLGAGVLLFTVRFYTQDIGEIGVSKAGTNLKEIARVKGVQSGDTVRLSDHDHTSRDYVVKAGEHFIAENEAGHLMVARIDAVDFEGRAGARRHEVRFTFRMDISGQLGISAI